MITRAPEYSVRRGEMDIQKVAQALASTIDPQNRAQAEAYLEQVLRTLNSGVVLYNFLCRSHFVGLPDARVHYMSVTDHHGPHS